MFNEFKKHLSEIFKGSTEWLLEEPHAVASVGFIRSIYGLTTLALMVTSWNERNLLFGPNGLLAGEELKSQFVNPSTWSVFNLISSTSGFDLAYIAFMIIAALTMLGLGGRLSLLFNYVGTWSLFSQNPLLADGGDNIMFICGIFLLLTRCYDRFTVKSKIGLLGRSKRPQILAPWLANLMHNTGVLLIGLQICIVYFIAGTYKMQGEKWTNGTALYYVLRNPEYYLPGIDQLFRFELPSVVMVYVTILSQVFFPVFVFFRKTRVIAVLVMMMFHIGIAVTMGLTSFALIMFSCDTIFVGRELARLADRVTGRETPARNLTF